MSFAKQPAAAEPAGFPVPGLVRRVRRIAGLSQRELAQAAGVSRATIGRIELGSLAPSLAVLERIFGVAGLSLAVVNDEGRVIQPMVDWADARDGADRRYPSHLDTIIDPEPGEWWGDQYGLARPPETFYRDQRSRTAQRRRSQWEVRAAKHRGEPPPPRAPDYR
ncbi:helix-turn-helix transcriptional regulator [Actinoplanes sp. NPDC026619]|uniref:helix-turn-helix transcriptional regulator n=1 Tax=Actinoplanes sp. NPDC026619 TaxID=3155798 RepID=UPI00340A9538